MSELSIPEEEALTRVAEKPELQAHFFGKIKKLKWLEPIVTQGFLKPSENPRPQLTKDKYIRVPVWPVLDYLVAASESLSEPENEHIAERFMDVIRDITRFAMSSGFSNHRTWWQFSKIIRNVPSDFVSIDDFELICFWLSDPYDKTLVGRELESWLMDMVSGYREEKKVKILSLASEMFQISAVESKFSKGSFDATFPMEKYQASKLVERFACRAGEVIGIEAVLLFESKLDDVLVIEGNDKWSAIWRPAIEDHEQNRTREDAAYVLINAVRDSLDAFINADPQEAEAHLNDLLISDHQVKRRIGLFTASNNFSKISDSTKAKVVCENNFNDSYRHELWWFLKGNYLNLSDLQKDQVLSIISNMQAESGDGNIDPRATAYKKSLWLSSIKEADVHVRNLYRHLIEVAGVEPEHPDFASYTTFGPITYESPTDLLELKEMLQDPDRLICYLNSFEQEGSFSEPSLEGLVKTFGVLVQEKFEELPDYLNYFIELDIHFVHEILSQFLDAWREKRKVDWGLSWDAILNFSMDLVIADDFWDRSTEQPKGAFVGNRHWVVSALSRLIESGCKSDEHAFGLQYVRQAKGILEVILFSQEGEEFTQSSDAVSVAINSPRGRCLEAYINLALYECRNNKSRRNEIWESYNQVFSEELLRKKKNEYEFSTLVANFLPNFRYLSNSWVNTNLATIFDRSNHQSWLCAVQGFSYVGRFEPQTYEYLKNSGDLIQILDNEELKERVEDRYIQFIVISYYHEREALSEEGSLIQCLLDRKKPDELSALVWFIWTLRKDNESRVKSMVDELFPPLIDCIQEDDQGSRKLASKLCLWADFFDEFDDQVISWLKAIARYAGEDFNSHHILDALVRLSETEVMEAYRIWKLLLQNHTYDYPHEPIKTIFTKLVSHGSEGARAAKEVAGLYMSAGQSRPLDWLNEIVRASQTEDN